MEQRNCPKQLEFYCKNKFEKLVHSVDFTIRILSSVQLCRTEFRDRSCRWSVVQYVTVSSVVELNDNTYHMLGYHWEKLVRWHHKEPLRFEVASCHVLPLKSDTKLSHRTKGRLVSLYFTFTSLDRREKDKRLSQTWEAEGTDEANNTNNVNCVDNWHPLSSVPLRQSSRRLPKK